MAKVVFLWTRIDQAVKVGVDPSIVKKMEYNALNGVWNDSQKKFVAPGSLNFSWVAKLMEV